MNTLYCGIDIANDTAVYVLLGLRLLETKEGGRIEAVRRLAVYYDKALPV